MMTYYSPNSFKYKKEMALMMDYSPNSHKYKKEQESPPEERKKIEKVCE